MGLLSRGVPVGKRRRAPSVFASILVVAAFALGGAQSARAGDTIEGTVTSAATKAPIEGIEVCAGRFVYEQKCATTAANGSYVVPGPPVPVRVEFNAPAGSGFAAHTYYKGVYLFSQATELTVPVGETISGIDAELQREGRIEGVVTNSSTETPVAGMEVCASPSGDSPEAAQPTCVSTDAGGVYEIPGLAPVQYGVKFKPGALNFLPETVLRRYELSATVTAGVTTSNVDIALPEGGQVEGQVTSAATGLPLADAQACAEGDGPSLETKCADTDANGHYLIDGLETSAYRVSFWPGRPYVPYRYDEGKTVSVKRGETLAGVNGSVLTGATISGRVTSANTGAPLREVEVCLDETVGEATSGICVEPDEAGEYTFTGIRTSTDTVMFDPKQGSGYGYELQYWNHVGVSTESTELHVAVGENVTGIDAALDAQYGIIAGRVLGVPGVHALSDARACAENIDTSQWRCANANAQGEYEITALPSGRYRVEFSAPNYVPELYDGKLTAAEAEPVAVSAGSTTSGIDAELVERASVASSIGGVVSSASAGQPIAGIEVCAYDVEKEEEELFGSCATTDASGKYSISNLPTGEYLVEFSSPSASALDYVTQYYDDTESPQQALVVEVDPGTADIGIDAHLYLGGRIGGRVTSASGGPLENVLVCALASANEAVACAVSDRDGEYAIAGVPAGSYVVGFQDGRAYVVQYYDEQTSFPAAQAVTVTVGDTTSGVDAALQPVAPPPPPEPPLPPQPVAPAPQQSPLADAGPSAPVPVPAPAGPSAPLSVPAQVAPVVTAPQAKIVISGSTAALALSCGDAACKGSVELTSRFPAGRDHAGKPTSRGKTAVLASGSFSLAKGARAVAVLHLTAAGRHRLARAKRHPITVNLVVSVKGGKTIVTAVVVS